MTVGFMYGMMLPTKSELETYAMSECLLFK